MVNEVFTTSFFRNPYVKALLRGLEDRHCPTYWLKTMRIIRCINGVLTEYIYPFMTEHLLKFETSIFYSASDFCWDRVLKKSFGACIRSFMANIYTFKNGIYIFSQTKQLSTSLKMWYNPQSQPLLTSKPLLILYASKNLTQVRNLAICFIQSTRGLCTIQVLLEVIWLVVPIIPVNMLRW